MGGNGIKCGNGKKEESFDPSNVAVIFPVTEKQEP